MTSVDIRRVLLHDVRLVAPSERTFPMFHSVATVHEFACSLGPEHGCRSCTVRVLDGSYGIVVEVISDDGRTVRSGTAARLVDALGQIDWASVYPMKEGTR
jgi:hypothetical protein